MPDAREQLRSAIVVFREKYTLAPARRNADLWEATIADADARDVEIAALSVVPEAELPAETEIRLRKIGEAEAARGLALQSCVSAVALLMSVHPEIFEAP